MRAWCFRLLLLVVPVVVVTGCQNQSHVGDGGLYALAMTSTTPPFATSRNAALYITERRVELPILAPTADQLAQLSAQIANYTNEPYPRLPWVQRGDYEIECDWTVKNLTDQPVSVAVTFNGFNEFDEYVPGFALNNQDIVPDYAEWEWRFDLQPNQSRSMTTREDQFDEMAVDLATVVNGLPNANLAVSPGSQSATDPRVQQYIPPVIPALTGFRIGLRVQTGGGPPPELVLEATVRVRDVHHKLVDALRAWQLPMPTPFTPASVVNL